MYQMGGRRFEVSSSEFSLHFVGEVAEDSKACRLRMDLVVQIGVEDSQHLQVGTPVQSSERIGSNARKQVQCGHRAGACQYTAHRSKSGLSSEEVYAIEGNELLKRRV